MNPFEQAEIEAEEKRQKEQIRDIEIIKYINDNDLFVCSKEDGISKDELFEVLKQIDTKEQNIIQKIAPELGVEYHPQYEIYLAMKNDDIKRIEMIITIEKVQYDCEKKQSALQFMQQLIKMGSLIVIKYPLTALDIYYHIENNIAKEIGLRPYEIINFTMDIIDNIANTDILKALSLLDIIEPYFKQEVLNKIIKKTNDKEIHNKINEIITTL